MHSPMTALALYAPGPGASFITAMPGRLPVPNLTAAGVASVLSTGLSCSAGRQSVVRCACRLGAMRRQSSAVHCRQRKGTPGGMEGPTGKL